MQTVKDLFDMPILDNVLNVTTYRDERRPGKFRLGVRSPAPKFLKWFGERYWKCLDPHHIDNTQTKIFLVVSEDANCSIHDGWQGRRIRFWMGEDILAYIPQTTDGATLIRHSDEKLELIIPTR